MSELDIIPATFNFSTPIAITDKQWNVLQDALGSHISKNKKNKIESRINEYIEFEIIYLQGSRPGKLKIVLSSILDASNNLLSEINYLFQFEQNDDISNKILNDIMKISPECPEELESMKHEIDEYIKKIGLGIKNNLRPDNAHAVAMDVIERASDPSFSKNFNVYNFAETLRELVDRVNYCINDLPYDRKGRPENKCFKKFLLDIKNIVIGKHGRGVNTNNYKNFLYEIRELLVHQFKKSGLPSIAEKINHRDRDGLVNMTEDAILESRRKKQEHT